MASSEKIMNACLDGFNNKAFRPRDGKTYCNQFVSSVAIELGYRGFIGLTANRMVDLMRSSSDWQHINMDVAASCASFSFVIAGVVKPKHGHVLVIVEGKPVYSGKWKQLCPLGANVGPKGKDGKWAFIKGINWAFKAMPDCWRWLEKNRG